MRSHSLLLSLLLLSQSLHAAPQWMRYPAISPDGKRIAFTYQGDIYTVASTGGKAKQLTTSGSYDSTPIWSPTSKHIAFSSKRFGNQDVFIMPAKGGQATRLTTNSNDELPIAFTPTGDAVLFTSSRISTASDRMFPASYYLKTYSVSIKGGREQLISASPAERGQLSQDGTLYLYNDIKCQENTWRKHHRSSATRDIMLLDRNKQHYQVLTSNIGEDRNPVFSADEQRIYYLSEMDGKSFNIYCMDRNNPQSITPITDFQQHPVRFLSIAKNNTLCFGYHGEIYTQQEGGQAEKVSIEIINDKDQDALSQLNLSGDMDSVAISKDGSQIAFIMRGEVFVCSPEYGLTKQITHTPQAEYALSFSPDGRQLIYGSERSGQWNIYQASITHDEELDFTSCSHITEEALLQADEHERMIPSYSPDGKEIAFIEDRNKLMVYNIESKQIRCVCDERHHFIQHPNGFEYQWSPDSKSFAMEYVAEGHDPYYDIGIISAQGGAIANVTQSGYQSGSPRWALDGKALLYTTDKYGMRNHASWGSQRDIMIAFVNEDSYDEFTLSEEEYKLIKAEKAHIKKLQKEKEKKEKAQQEQAKATDPEKDKNELNKDEEEEDEQKDEGAEEGAEGDTEDTGDDADKEDKDDDEDEEEEKNDIILELDKIHERVQRISPSSANLGDLIMSKDGEKIFFIMNNDLYEIKLRSRELKTLHPKTSGQLLMDEKGKKLFIIKGSSLQSIEIKDNKKKSISYRATMQWNAAAERNYMFNNVVTEELKRFYDVNMHGVNWLELSQAYAPQLQHINNNEDFAECLSELLGELNVSHTGSKYYPSNKGDETAELGLLFDENDPKAGLLITEVLPKGPFDKSHIDVKPGDRIIKIDGTEIREGMDYYPLLNHKAHQRLAITLQKPQGEEYNTIIKASSKQDLSEQLYQRWVKWQEQEVERLSEGRLGYIHLRGMSDQHFRSLYSNVLGKYNKRDGIIIDTRNNGGGRLHEDIEIMFSGNKYLTQVIRGREACDMPSRRWNKASIMITNEANYSNSHGTPWVYQTMKLGKIIGMPVPGTMSSVNWVRMQDKSLLYGIPVVGFRTKEGNYLENTQLEPDIKVKNQPEHILNNKDEQLEQAVAELLKSTETTEVE